MKCHLLRVGPSIDIDDERVALGLGEVGRKIKTNLATLKLIMDLFLKVSDVNYLGLVLAAIHGNVEIGHLRYGQSVSDSLQSGNLWEGFDGEVGGELGVVHQQVDPRVRVCLVHVHLTRKCCKHDARIQVRDHT